MEGLAQRIPPEKRQLLEDLMKYMKEFMSGGGDFGVTTWKGYNFIPGFEAETAKYTYENMDCPDNSVFVITFPKTGTNWTTEIARQILYGHDEKLDSISKSVPPPIFGLEISSVRQKLELCPYIPLPRFLFLSHLAEELVNVEEIKKKHGKIIVTLRNPKDQTVSLFHFMQGPMFDRMRERISPDWTTFFNSYIAGELPLITKESEWYIDHVLGWYKRWWGDKDVLFLFFEDMKKDPMKEIGRMAEFIGVDLSAERLKEIVEATSFKAMKNASGTPGKPDESSVGYLRSKARIMRKGQVGEWKEVFTVAQSELVDKLVEEKLGQTDIKFTYEI